jgi:hypothetical protein
MPDDSELERLDPQLTERKLSTGFALGVRRMRTRQFFRLLRILTHGAGPALTQAQLNFGGDPAEFGQKLLMLVVMSIPDAEQETIAFLASMCEPAGLSGKQASQLTRQEADADKALWDRYGEELHNPELDDTLDLIEVIVRQEAPELQALGKKLRKTLEMFRKTGQDKEAPEAEATPQDLSSPAPSRRRSTRSVTSTDGPTSTSSDSPSAG